MKRIISVLMSMIMAFSIVSGIKFKVSATEGTNYLSEDDVMWFTNKFLYTLTESEKAAYGDALLKLNPDVEWAGEEYEKIKVCVDKVQAYWNKICPFLPKTITENDYVKLGNNLCGYFSCTIGALKNVYYITNEDTNNIQKSYHYLKSFNSICSTLGWSLGPLSTVLSAVSATLPIADILYSSTCQESLNFYEAQLQIEYWDPSDSTLTTPEEAMVQPAFKDLINDQKYIDGLNALYIKYSLMQMADEMKKITVINPIGEKCNYAGHTYQVFDISKNWTEAKEYCENLGGHLVTITDSNEQSFVSKLAKNGTKDTYWLGASDVDIEGQWKWVTEEVFEYQNGSFDNGPPGPEDWLEMIASNGSWNDGEHDGQGSSGIYALCNHGFICEWDNYIDPYPTMNDEHRYAQTVIAPTCTADGYTVNRCTDCELEYYSNNVSKLGHDYKFSKTVAPTCTAQGYDLYTCSRCNGTERRNTVSAIGHKYTFTKTVAPTCTAQGYDLYTCTQCNGTEHRNTVNATGHSYSLSGHKEPNCNEAGFNKYTCSVCNNSYQDEIAVLDGSALTTALEKTQKYLAKDYFTEESLSNLQAVYDNHKNDLATLSTQEAVDNAVTELNTAISELVLGDCASGETAEGFSWNWERSTGTLTVRGSGAMPNYNATSMPWYDVIPYTTQIVVSDGITSIGKFAFYKAQNVKCIIFPNGLEIIEQRAFEYCSSVEELIVPNSVKQLGYGTFANMTSLKKVTVPASATYRSYCFDKDTAVEEVIITYGADGIIPNSNVTKEQGLLFDMMQKKTGNFGPWRYAENTTVKILDGVTSVGAKTFYNCTGVSSIEMPNSVTSIGEQAFYGCTSLTSVIIPDSVTSISGNVFEGCTEIKILGFDNSAAKTYAENNSMEFCLMGDIDGDGVYGTNDYAMLMSQIFCQPVDTATPKAVGDINGDGAIDGFDVIQLDLYLNGTTDIHGNKIA